MQKNISRVRPVQHSSGSNFQVRLSSLMMSKFCTTFITMKLNENCCSFSFPATASTRCKRTRSERCYLSYLRGLVLGDLVRFLTDGKEEEGTVKEVDRFQRCLLVTTSDGDRDVHASALLVPEKGKPHFPSFHPQNSS